MTPAPGTLVAERFRLVRPLSKGGMGAVWLAEHTGLDVPCAIKFIQAEAKDSAEVRQRFEREAKLSAQLRSPHVVHVLDHGVWEETPYIAMEFLEGEDLEDRIERVGRLGAAETASIAAQVARALTRAHAAGLVHRDLKPANIFLAHDDDREIVKVLDFGIAKDSTPRMPTGSNTKTGSLIGTPAYMSPEQAQGTKRVDHRSDLWALAVVVYECLTGELPFQSEALGDLLLKIMVSPLPVPSQIAPVPPGFDGWWARAASRDPEGRFQSAKELADSLIVALGVSSSDSGAFRLSLSDVLSSPGVDRTSTRGLAAPSGLPRDLQPRAFASAPTLPAPDPEGPRPASVQTLALTESRPFAPRSTPQPSSGDAGLMSRAPSPGSGSLNTGDPVSTSLSPELARDDEEPPAGGRSRIALAAIAGLLVAGAVTLLALRAVAPDADARPADQAADPPAVTAPPPADTAAPAVTDTAAPAATDTAAPAASEHPPADPAASQPRGKVPPKATGTGGASTRPTRPGGSSAPPKKGPKDFGI